jgi:hypothetical protein
MACREDWSAKELAMPLSPPRSSHDRDEERELLEELANRVMITRRARTRHWGPLGHQIEEWCWAAIGEALDELERIAPEQWGRPAHQRHERLLDDLRDGLRLDDE